MKISAVVITKNEAKNIRRCLESVQFSDEMIVIDSGSTDETMSIAKDCGAKVVSHPFEDFASQKNFAVEKASGEWVISLDADEEITPSLAAEIQSVVRESNGYSAYAIKRDSVIFGESFKKTGTQNDYPIRLFVKSKARFRQRIHEVLDIEGNVGRLNEKIIHYTFQNTHAYLKRLNQYTSLEAEESGDYTRMGGKAFLRFLDMYFWRQGFLDGKSGFYLSFLSGWYEFVKRAKRWERTKQV